MIAVSSKLVIATASAKMIRIWDMFTDKEVTRLTRASDDIVSSLAFSSDGTLLAIAQFLTGRATSTVSVWDHETCEKPCTLELYGQLDLHISAVAISADNNLIACSQEDKTRHGDPLSTVLLYKIATGRKVGRFIVLQNPARTLSFLQGSLALLCCCGDRVEIWDVATYRRTEAWHYEGIESCSHIVTPSLMMISTDRSHGKLSIEHLGSRLAQASIRPSSRASINCLAYSSSTKEVMFAGRDGLVGTWNSWTGSLKRPTNVAGDKRYETTAVAVSPDGTKIVYGDTEERVSLWSRGS
jgi:WD40 repeat protein